MLETFSCRTQSELLALQESETYRSRFALEVLIAARNQENEPFHLPGFCLLDNTAVEFEVDWQFSGERLEVDWLFADGKTRQVRIPNWRERLICPRCGLNNRQRALIVRLRDTVKRRAAVYGQRQQLYLMEQVTPAYSFCVENFADAEVIGSEFLGYGVPGGTVKDGLRHENVEALSFDDSSLDLILSSSVLEHVSEPMTAIHEMARVLRPGGELFLEVPFDVNKERNTRRAQLLDGQVVHLEEPAYHGDPMSEQGALVYTDFGWEFLDQIRDSGLFVCELEVYWSLEYGHLGGLQFFLQARRTQA